MIAPPDKPSAPLIQARGLVKSFALDGTVVEVLRGVDLAVARGECVAVEGASGSGKSTLLSLLAGLDRPDAGEVIFDGEPLAGKSEAVLARLRREKVGFVFQAFHLAPGLSALENVCLPAAFRDGHFDEARGRALLEGVGLAHRADFLPGKLSGGEQQRVAVARALSNDPLAVFADEPTGNLDSVSGRAVLDLLESRVRGAGKALVLVTHDPAVAARADRRIRVKDGRVL